ncbi:fimbrial protein [Lysobacter soli]|uniref:fimbrial protein n=1 Tax=Lysobacter soli TaxID=453783 RepID=UPI0012EE2FC5|nr:fimbrial protein [Lysobacter soli]QGW66409.1 fimbrial protein [Lysobacter soli]
MKFLEDIAYRGRAALGRLVSGHRTGVLAAVLMAVAFLPSVSHAECTVTQPGGPPGSAPVIFDIPATNIPINSNAPNGTLLATATVITQAPPGVTIVRVNCDYGVLSWDWTSPLPSVPGYPSNYFQTNIPGLAITIEYAYNHTLLPIMGSTIGAAGTSFLINDFTYTVRFYKVGPITQGGPLTGIIAQRFFHAYGVASPGFLAIQIGGGGIIIQPSFPTCSVSTPDVVVSLDQASAADFSSVGSALGEKDFNVSLACSGGDPSSSTNLHMFLTDQTTPANQTNILSLTSGSTAAGVGVQIVNNGTPVTFGQTSAAPTTDITRNIVVNTPTVDIPLKARYVRTGNMTAGSVTAIATFTTTYN